MVNIFISHSWKYEKHYDTLKKWLDESTLDYKNMSIPIDDPIHSKTDKELKDAIENKIKVSSVVLVMAGVYSSYSRWIDIEIEISKEYSKYIIAVKPWAQTNLSSIVQSASNKIVGWNSASVISAIKESC